jgi:hypothetical protein
MNSVFTESYAAYLFIILAIAMMICGFIFAAKGGKWLFWLATFGWAMAAFYSFSVQASLLSFVHFLGFFEVLAAFGCGFMPMILRDKKEAPAKLTTQQLAQVREDELRRLRYGNQPGYEENGKRASGW